MGYLSRLTGDLIISPPLQWWEFKNTDWAGYGVGCLSLEIESEDIDTDNGVLTTKTADLVIPVSEDDFKVYTLKEDVKRLLADFPNHEFHGSLRVEGEDSGDIWRIVVDGREARTEKAQLSWPDGAVESGR